MIGSWQGKESPSDSPCFADIFAPLDINQRYVRHAAVTPLALLTFWIYDDSAMQEGEMKILL